MSETLEGFSLPTERLKTQEQIYRLLSPNSIYEASCLSFVEDSASSCLPDGRRTFGTFWSDKGLSKYQAVAVQLDGLLDEFNNHSTCVLVGTTGTVTFGDAPSSPSAFPKVAAGYINHLHSVNRTLEYRVEELEQRLNEMQVYWPTIKKLVAEYGSASGRVSTALSHLGRAYNPEQAWKIALERDVLSAPMEEDSELV
jgi:hypothetical protein